MNQDEQAILARDMIQMIRENADNSDVLEYLDSFAFSLARGLVGARSRGLVCCVVGWSR